MLRPDPTPATSEAHPPRLRRAESFLGIHFDFHARDIQIPVGRNTTAAMVDMIIDRVKPDYIQCDCKGHHGLSSYPTGVGNQAPVVVGDPLRVWRDATARRGVALYVHYSGLYDTRAVTLHPEWARIDEKGEPDPNVVSVFSPYVDELLLPQLKELIDGYGIDGVWVDGDCWAAARDYSPAALEAFRRATGIESVPRLPGDSHYGEFSEFCRESYRRYLRHYVDDLHRHDPTFQVASNWSFSSFMPEPVSAGVDFLTGDSAPIAKSYVRLEARCLARQGRPWDVMTWSFGGAFQLEGTAAVGLKSPVQLKQEAATILALGAGYQSVSNQKLDGSIIPWHLDLMAEVAEFCRERQTLCHGGQLVPQVGLLHSGTASYAAEGPLFLSIGRIDNFLGTLEALLASQLAVDVVMPHQLDCAPEYPVLVLPEWAVLPNGMRERLLEYVESGGNLLVIGPRAVRLFERELDVSLVGEVDDQAVRFIEHGGALDGHRGPYQAAVLGPRARPFGRLYPEFDTVGAHEPAAAITSFGRGRIAGVFLDLGEFYHRSATVIARDFLHGLVSELFPDPIAEVTGSHLLDVVVTRQAGDLIIHLINTAGRQDSERVHTFDEIPRLGPLKVRLRLADRPSRVTLEPGGVEPRWSYGAGEVDIEIPSLDVHLMVVARA